MTREEVENFLRAQLKTGKTKKETSRIGAILDGILQKKKFTVEELREDSPIESKLSRELSFQNIKHKRKVDEGKYTIDIVVKNIAIECDGYDWHHKTFEQVERDRKRDKYLMSKGWVILRFSGSQIQKNPAKCVEQIRNLMKAKDLAKGIG